MALLLVGAILAEVIAIISQKSCTLDNNIVKRKVVLWYYLLSFAILSSLCFFCKSGADIATYSYLYTSWEVNDLFSSLDIEFGYKALCILLRLVFKNPYIGLGIIKVISIALVYRAVYLIQDRVYIGLAVLSYIVLLYVCNYCLLRMMLAVGIVFVAFAYEINGKRKRCVLYLILAFAFHYSSIVALMSFAFYIILGKKISIGKMTISAIVLGIMYVSFEFIFNRATSSVEVFQKYAGYSQGSIYSSSGIAQLILFIPVLIILIYGYRNGQTDAFYKLSLVCGVMTFFTGSLGYIYSVTSRSVYYFYFFFVGYGASVMTKDNKIVFKFGRVRFSISTLALIIYLLMILYLNYILGNTLASAGLEKIIFIWE